MPLRLPIRPLVALALPCWAVATPSAEPRLLFHLSGQQGTIADVSAAGRPEPTFHHEVSRIPDGAVGEALRCGHTQLLAYRAPGHIHAQRGTLAFYWRAREPVGPTEFPIFRVGYSDHSSWDMVWLRLDYNGHGFDAFVTDTNLARVRVSTKVSPFPSPETWTHLAFTWDETEGVRLYINGTLAAEKRALTNLDAGLDQFGPHSRIISPYQVQSAYNFVRGGDLDELRIYDRALSEEAVAKLAQRSGDGEKGRAIRSTATTMERTTDSAPRWRAAWWKRYGWNAPTPPSPLASATTRLRKVEIHDAFDLKRWYWKANDGIRETTWPAPFNRSRIEGRTDYFLLPDWDCYSTSGRTITFSMPDEPWNHLEIAGAAWGTLTADGATPESNSAPLRLERPRGLEKTSHRLPAVQRGGRLRFDNTEPETPIQELAAYLVDESALPSGVATLSYTLRAGLAPANAALSPLVNYVRGRHPAEEQTMMLALPAGAPLPPAERTAADASTPLPIVHVLVPSDFRSDSIAKGENRFSYTWQQLDGGLDGIVLELPAQKGQPTHGEWLPLNVQVRDPIWPARTMLDVNVSIRPGEARTLWLDLRDRILPPDRSLYLVIAAAGSGFSAKSLEGASLRLVFKARREAQREHEADRFTQLRDSFAMLTEEYPNHRRFDLYNRFEADATDLLRVNPDHTLGRRYWWLVNPEQPMPHVDLKPVPEGVPAWAVRQVELLGYIRRMVEWYIDHRQIENGEFGGGLSDDGDFTNYWPATALMGCIPEKISASLLRHMEAYYQQGMFTNGLSSIQTDELHSYEEGIQVLGQCVLLDYGNPRHLERAMETSLGIERIVGVNAAGHTHIRSSYFSGTRIAEEGVWGWSKAPSYLILHPTMGLTEYAANPRSKKLLVSLAEGLLAHRRRNADGTYSTYSTIEFATDKDAPGRQVTVSAVFWAAWRLTQDRRFLDPIFDAGPNSWDTLNNNALDELNLRGDWAAAANRRARVPSDGLSAGQRANLTAEQHFAWQVTGDKTHLEKLYTQQVRLAAIRDYANKEGSLWIDRVSIPFNEIQRARLGGVALQRNAIYPGHVVSWRFDAPATGESVAVLIPDATPEKFTVLAYNLETTPVTARVTGGMIEPGTWEIIQGVDTNGDDCADTPGAHRLEMFERSTSIGLKLPPRTTSVITFKRVKAGTPYWKRPDVGFGADDVVRSVDSLRVRLHSLGAVEMPPSELALVDAEGKILRRAKTPALPPPLDLQPRTAEVTLSLASLDVPAGAMLVVNPENSIEEITTANNRVRLPIP